VFSVTRGLSAIRDVKELTRGVYFDLLLLPVASGAKAPVGDLDFREVA
jgi:hypothetical protein